MAEKKPSIMEEQQAALKAKKEALSGKRLRLAGLLPAQRLGDPPPVTPAKIPLWPLLLLLPLLLIPLRPKTQPPKAPPPLNLSLPQVVFPAKLTLFYQDALREEALVCQNLFQKLGIEVELEPLYGPAAKENSLYLLEGAITQRWQEENLLAPLSLQGEGLPLGSLIYPSLWGKLARGQRAWALPMTVEAPFLFVQQLPWKQTGLGENQIPTSWEEILSLLPRLQRFDPDGRPTTVFWPFEESPLLWTYMLDRNLGQDALNTTAAWLGQLWYRQKLTTNTQIKKSLMLVATKAPASDYYRALPPTPGGNPSSLLAKVSYLALPRGSKLAAKLPQLYAALPWQISRELLPPILGKASGVELTALARSTPLFLEPKRQQELIYSIYKKLETNGKEEGSAGN